MDWRCRVHHPTRRNAGRVAISLRRDEAFAEELDAPRPHLPYAGGPAKQMERQKQTVECNGGCRTVAEQHNGKAGFGPIGGMRQPVGASIQAPLADNNTSSRGLRVVDSKLNGRK